MRTLKELGFSRAIVVRKERTLSTAFSPSLPFSHRVASFTFSCMFDIACSVIAPQPRGLLRYRTNRRDKPLMGDSHLPKAARHRTEGSGVVA